MKRRLLVTMFVASAALADAGTEVGPLDQPAVTDPDVVSCARGSAVQADPSCKTLASRTIAGTQLRVVVATDGMDDTAYVEVGGARGAIYYDHVMHYTKMMGERGDDIQTERNWSAKPRIAEGTLADGSKAAIILLPWTSHTYERATGKLLSAEALHGVIMVCAVGKAAACAPAREVDCSDKGCGPKLDRGVLAW
jgi:hypothetical protein